MHTITFKTLTKDQMIKVIEWLRENKVNPQKIRREFSDGYLLAELLQRDFPKQIDLNNYPRRSRIAFKIQNWGIFEFKFLKKFNMTLGKDFIEELAKGSQGAIEVLIYEIILLLKRQKYKVAKRKEQIAELKTKEEMGVQNDKVEEAVEIKNENIKDTVQGTSRTILFDRCENVSCELPAKDAVVTSCEACGTSRDPVLLSMEGKLHPMSCVIETLAEAKPRLLYQVNNSV